MWDEDRSRHAVVEAFKLDEDISERAFIAWLTAKSTASSKILNIHLLALWVYARSSV